MSRLFHLSLPTLLIPTFAFSDDNNSLLYFVLKVVYLNLQNIDVKYYDDKKKFYQESNHGHSCSICWRCFTRI